MRGGYLLTLDNDDELAVKLVVGADDANSQVRADGEALPDPCSAVPAVLHADHRAVRNAPGESTQLYFTPNGPHAFLPLFDNWASLVCGTTNRRIRQVQGLSMDQLRREIRQHFRSRLGNVTPVAAGAFPLMRRHAFQHMPVKDWCWWGRGARHSSAGGAGVNLGYRDVDALLDAGGNARAHAEARASHQVLKRYQTRRMADNFIGESGMDLFYAGFTLNDVGPVRIVRNIGLMAAERAGGLKRQA